MQKWRSGGGGEGVVGITAVGHRRRSCVTATERWNNGGGAMAKRWRGSCGVVVERR